MSVRIGGPRQYGDAIHEQPCVGVLNQLCFNSSRNCWKGKPSCSSSLTGFSLGTFTCPRARIRRDPPGFSWGGSPSSLFRHRDEDVVECCPIGTALSSQAEGGIHFRRTGRTCEPVLLRFFWSLSNSLSMAGCQPPLKSRYWIERSDHANRWRLQSSKRSGTTLFL